MQFASVLFHDPDDGGHNYERTAFAPDDWTPSQALAAMLQHARERGEEGDWLVPLLEHDGPDSITLYPVVVIGGVHYVEPRTDVDFTTS